MAKIFNGSPEFESLSLNDLIPPNGSGLQLVASDGDEELFRTTAKMAVELQDYGGANPSQVTGVLADECPSLVAKYGTRVIEQMAKLIFASEIRSLSNSSQFLFDSFNRKYFSGALDRYSVHVVFDLHTVANEPVYRGSVSTGLIRFEEHRIYIRYSDDHPMQETLIHEMAHAATSGEHDERWRAEMVRLKTAGAPVPEWELES
jgi:hypothetical protein